MLHHRKLKVWQKHRCSYNQNCWWFLVSEQVIIQPHRFGKAMAVFFSFPCVFRQQIKMQKYTILQTTMSTSVTCHKCTSALLFFALLNSRLYFNINWTNVSSTDDFPTFPWFYYFYFISFLITNSYIQFIHTMQIHIYIYI